MKTYLCTAIVHVEDEDVLIEYANERVKACWQDSLESMRDRGQTLVEAALSEALFASNENPSPDQYGISFQEIRVQSLDIQDGVVPGR